MENDFAFRLSLTILWEERMFLTLNILFSWSVSDCPGNSGLIDKNSANIQPTDHISIGVEYSLQHSNSSGARYHSVTTTDVYGFNGDPYSRAKPKSPTFNTPLWDNSKFDVFKSRCNIQLSCKCATARSNCCVKHFTSAGKNDCFRCCIVSISVLKSCST